MLQVCDFKRDPFCHLKHYMFLSCNRKYVNNDEIYCDLILHLFQGLHYAMNPDSRMVILPKKKGIVS